MSRLFVDGAFLVSMLDSILPKRLAGVIPNFLRHKKDWLATPPPSYYAKKVKTT
jgi:hypothetical protein